MKKNKPIRNAPRRPETPVPADTGQTVAALVRLLEPTWSWSKCREMVANGRVLVNEDVVTDPAARFAQDASVRISDKRLTPKVALPSLHVYFYDSQLIIVEKLSGIESVPFSTKSQNDGPKKHAKTDTTLIDIARLWLESKENQKLPPLRIVHRIDKGTSGIVVFARTQSAERALNQQFRAHSIKRHYLAVTLGVPSSRTIRSTLVEDRGDGYRGSRATVGPQKLKEGKDAITHVKLLETAKNERYALVECRLETGRTHQIRIHLSELGHPLCGDAVYRRPRPHAPALDDESGAKRMMLHAAELGFIHPTSEELVHYMSPLPAEFADFWRKLSSD